MRQFRVEGIIGVTSLLLGAVNIATKYYIWHFWNHTPGLADKAYFTRILKYVAISGIVVWGFEKIFFSCKMRDLHWRLNIQVYPSGATLSSRWPFIYYPITFNAGFFLMWDICTILTGALVDLPIVVLAYNLTSNADCAEFPNVELLPEFIIVTVVMSLLHSTWLFAVSLFKAIWNCTIPSELILDCDEADYSSFDRKMILVCWPILVLGFSGGFLVPAFIFIDSWLVHVVNGVLVCRE